MIAILSALLLATVDGAVLHEDASAGEIIAACRSMVPDNAELSGRLIYTRKKSVVTGKRETERDYRYHLKRSGRNTDLKIAPSEGGEFTKVEAPKDGVGAIEGTGVEWSDLTLDYLWWDDVKFDPEEKTETPTLFKCARLLLTKGERTIRVWITYKHGAPEKAEELRNGEVVRKLWASSIKKFGERWMASRLEVQDVATRRRTRITVEDVKVN